MNSKDKDIGSFEELKQRVFGKCSGTICHYTSYESLVLILKNKSLRLTRYDLMNDYAEKQLSKATDGDYRYIVSFTGTTKESVAMWALYGKHSSLKLRLDIPRGKLIETANNNFFFDSKKEEKIPTYNTGTIPCDYKKKNYSLSDVVYYDKRRNVFKLSGKSLNSIEVSPSKISNLAGTIKYDAWEYEKEARLSVVLHQDSGTESKNYTHIYTGLSDDFIKSICVTYSPWISDEIFGELRTSIDSLAGTKLKHRKSTLQGEIAEIW